MAGDEVYGDEYVTDFSADELGGAALLEELRKFGNEASSESDGTSESKGETLSTR